MTPAFRHVPRPEHSSPGDSPGRLDQVGRRSAGAFVSFILLLGACIYPAVLFADAGANDLVIAIAIQTDGKIIIGGDFTTYDGTTRVHVARLNIDGSLDATFDPGTGANGRIHTAALQSDGKIIIGGDFTSYTGVSRNRIARLNSDGSLDATFDPGTGASSGVQSAGVQTDGKIIIGGFFASYNEIARNRVARLSNDGSLDPTFDPGEGPDGDIYYVAASSGGSVLIGGPFHNCDGVSRNNIAQLNANGTLDTVFDPGAGTSFPGGGADSFVHAIVVEDDGTIAIVGYFNNYNGVSRNCVARLIANGSLDTTFDPGTGASNALYAAAVQSDGKIVVGGQLLFYNGASTNHLARINADGSRDSGFNEGTGASGEVDGAALQSDGKIIIGGGFTSYNGASCNRIARVNSDGILDNTFDLPPAPTPTPTPNSTGAPVLTVPRNLTARDTNEAFDPVASTWAAKAPMPTARSSLGVAVIDDRIYVAGGDNVGNLCQPANILEAYDPATDSWATLRPMLHPRWDMGAAALGGLFYVVGGQTDATACGAAEATMEAYDPATNTWSAKPSMNFPRRDLAVVSLNGILYAIGGIDSANACVDTVEAFDPLANGGTGAWTTKQHLNIARGLVVGAAVGGKIYAITRVGGSNCDNLPSSIEEFDPAANNGMGTWTTKTAIVPSRSVGYAAAVLDNKIYFIGGGVPVPASLELVTARVDVYDPVTDTFLASPPPPMLTARANLAAATAANKIYAIGGLDLPARIGQPFVYQITATNHPTSYGVSPALPSGLTLDSASGIISGLPSVGGTRFLTFTAANASGSDSRLIYFQVGPGPLPPGLQIASSSCVTSRTDTPFQFQVLAQNASPSATFTAGGLPYRDGFGPELSIDAQSGLIIGMVSSPVDGKPRTYGVSVSVIDGGETATGQLRLTFISDTTVPIITSGDTVLLVPGQPIIPYTITADHAGTFGYIGIDGIRNGALPPGLSFDGVDTISGTYTGGAAIAKNPEYTPGADFTVTTGDRSIQPYTIKIRPPLLFACEDSVTNPDGSALSPLNFFEAIRVSNDLPDLELEATGPDGRIVDFTPPTVTNAQGDNLPVVCNPSPPSLFPLGVTHVTCEADDQNSRYGATISFNVTVQDTTPPVITAIPTSITVGKAKTAKGAPQGAFVNFASQLAAMDLVDGAVNPTATPVSGTFFPFGTPTQVSVTATDSLGHISAPKFFTVNVTSKAPKVKAPTVSVTASPATLGEGQATTFTISASPANPSQPITVGYQMSCTQAPASDFFTVSGPANQVTIPSGAPSATVTMNARMNPLTSGSEMVTMTLQSGTGYALPKAKKGKPGVGTSAAVTITNSP